MGLLYAAIIKLINRIKLYVNQINYEFRIMPSNS